MSFVHLHLHSEFSLIDGIVRVEPLVEAVSAAGMPAVALTDQGNFFGMVKFYRAALAAGIKPILGADVWVADDAAADGRAHMTLLCMDDQGYRGLTGLLTTSYLQGQGTGVPVIERDWLANAAAGLILLAGPRSDVGARLLAGHTTAARECLVNWQECFGNRVYLELQRTGRRADETHLHRAVALAEEIGVPVVAGNDVRFLEAGEYEAHEARVCIQEGRTLNDPRRTRHYSSEQYLRSAGEMAAQFRDIPEALTNSVEIARRCNLSLELGQNALPEFPVPTGLTINDYLHKEAAAGLEARLDALALPPGDAEAGPRLEYRQRLERELGVIVQMGFPGYFLIVADFIRWARSQAIPVGPGRGSGAGSLVAYALGITDLDPIRYDLLFERFLNPERVSMPDFDIDFCMEKRDQVIEYVADKYGREKVSQIATHGTMAARAVVRDVGRVLGHPYGYVDRVAKLIPFEIGMTLTRALEQEEELANLYHSDDEVRGLLDMAGKLEGMARNVGKHAGGVVIAPAALTDFAPLFCEPGGTGLATQFDKDDAEAVGLVKFDFLGLRTLTIIDWTVKAVNELRAEGDEAPLTSAAIPLDDPETFELLKRCATTAVFQLESRGMKDLVRRLQPDSFEDIIALVALFRPGPLQSGMVDDFIDRKHGRRAVAYPTTELHQDALKPILGPTYGVILYQEQVMQIAQALAGYSLGRADLLRRAMSKKKAAEMAEQRQAFIAGAMERGIAEAHAGGLFDLIEKFAGYGFNKSHSAAYALLSYQTAWLKAHYPAPFMAAVLSSDMDNTDKVVTLIDECRSMGLSVQPPELNTSDYAFKAGGAHAVIYGLGAIKGVGQSAIDAMLEERAARGPYADLFELCRRVDLRRVNKRVLEALIRSGSVECLAANRATAMRQLPAALKAAEQHTRDTQTGQDDLFGLAATPAEPAAEPRDDAIAEWEERDRLAAEKETLGLYLTGHPIERYERELTGIVTGRLNRVAAGAVTGQASRQERHNGGRRPRGPRVTVAGLVMAMRVRTTNSGQKIAFLTLDDRTGRLDVAVFADAYKRFQHLLLKDAMLVVEGELGFDELTEAYRVAGERVLEIGEAREAFARRLLLDLDAAHAGNGFVPQLQEILAPFREGHCPVWLDYRGSAAQARLCLGETWCVRPSDELIRRLEDLANLNAVTVEYGAY